MTAKIDDFLLPNEDVRSPNWREGGKVHNWRNYVGENTRKVWSSFTNEQRLSIMQDADERAGLEDWD